MVTQPVEPLALRPPGAAKALSISERTLWGLTVPRGPIPCLRIGHGKRQTVLYPVADLKTWLSRQAEATKGATMTPIELLLAKLPDAKKTTSGWSAPCPAHDDQHASLSIAEGDDGRALIHCHAGCQMDSICKKLDLKPANLFTPASTSTKPRQSRPTQGLGRQDNGRPASKNLAESPSRSDERWRS